MRSCGVWSCLCCLSSPLIRMDRACKAGLVGVVVVATSSAPNRGGLCHSVAAGGRREKIRSRGSCAGCQRDSGRVFSPTHTCPRRLLAGANRRGDTLLLPHVEGIEVQAHLVVEIEPPSCGSPSAATKGGDDHTAVTCTTAQPRKARNGCCSSAARGSKPPRCVGRGRPAPWSTN